MKSEGPIHVRGRPLIPDGGPFIVGILNVTPDSFSDGGLYAPGAAAVEAGGRMAEEGAEVIDVGGESTRPGSRPVPADEQIRRTAPVIAALAERFGKNGPVISIDTRSAPVAEAALRAGASIINDVSALRDDPALAEVAARHGAGVVLMHMQGTPADMQIKPVYQDVVGEIIAFLRARIEFAVRAGIPRERLLVDPGLGFGKTTEHNLEIIRRLGELRAMRTAILVGPSRKRFIGAVLGIKRPTDRLMGTAAAVAACVLAGAECVRVHDVAAGRQVADMCAALRGAKGGGSPPFESLE